MKIAMSKAEGKRSLREIGEEDEAEEDDDQLNAINQEEAADKKKKKGKKAVFGREGKSTNLCQVENCTVDMSDAKRYHKRHKVCEFHAKAPVVRVSGLHQRYCQQCSRFHEIGEFDEAKRSCRRRLAGHNERRRKSSNECQRTEGSNRNES